MLYFSTIQANYLDAYSRNCLMIGAANLLRSKASAHN